MDMTRRYKNENMLVVVDMLYEFTYGRLGSERARSIIPNVAKLVKTAQENQVPVVFANDAHMPQDEELKVWGPHAMKGTPEARVIDEIPTAGAAYLGREWKKKNVRLDEAIGPSKSVIIEKWTYSPGCNYMGDVVKYFSPRTIYVTGINTDICVKQTVADIFMNYGYVNSEGDKRLVVVKNAVQSAELISGDPTRSRDHNYAMKEMRTAYKVRLENASDVNRVLRRPTR